MGIRGGIAFFVMLSVVSTLAIGIQLLIILYLSEWTLRNAGYLERDGQRNRYVKFLLRLTASFFLSGLLAFPLVMGESDLVFSVFYYLPVLLFSILIVLLVVYLTQEASQ